jgi:hypothetical protein
MLDRNHNSNENHGADLISYIYGEMDEHARNTFESHLAQCDECALELGAMADARLGVIEWRRNDFDHLITPEILVPRETTEAALASRQEKKGLFAGLAELIGSVSVFAKAGVGLATAALLIGVIYFAFAPRSINENVTGKNENELPATITEKKEDGFKQEQAVVPPDKSPERIETPIRAPGRPTPSVKHRLANMGPLAVVNHSKVPNNVKKIGSETAKSVPRLNSFSDEEDKTLRLSDLFSQIGPGKK